MKFNKSNLKTMRHDILDALEAVEKKHGVRFSLGNITFSANDFRTRLECLSTADASGNSVDPDKVKFEKTAYRVGVKKDAYGKTFTSNGKTFRITGVNPRAKKYPIQAVTINRGKRYKFSIYMIPSQYRV